MTFTFPVRVYWEDTDASGHVFYANYLKFFERTRTEWLRHLGIHQHQLQHEIGGMFVVSHAEVSYLQPAKLDDMLDITAQLQSTARASITITQQAFLRPLSSDELPQLLCEGNIRIGWVNAATMRPVRIPNSIVEKLS